MSSSKVQDSLDDHSFETPPLSDPTGVPNFPPEEGRGQDFQPFKLEYRDFKINPLPKEPLQLFQLFIPISLIQSWIKYTNSWVSYLQENGVIDNWNTPLSEHSRILKWEGLSSATAYVWLGVVIYLGIHREISIKDHWKAPSLGDQRPLHSIIKFMPLRKFQLISRYFRTFDYTKVDIRDESDLPKTFQAAEEWSDLIQKVSNELYLPGTNLTVDECMVPFTGRSKETTLVKGKPTPVGFKVWVIAQQGFFLRWLWHMKSSPYNAVIINLPTLKPHGKRGKLRTEIPLSNTQSVVVHLVKRLIPQTYHVFTDNLFSSPQLFRLLRQLGFGATGTARPNCGITTEMRRIRETGKASDGMPLKYNEVILIPTEDQQVQTTFSCISLTNLSLFIPPRSSKSLGRIAEWCSSFQLYIAAPPGLKATPPNPRSGSTRGFHCPLHWQNPSGLANPPNPLGDVVDGLGGFGWIRSGVVKGAHVFGRLPLTEADVPHNFCNIATLCQKHHETSEQRNFRIHTI
jgi:hypothetical protein